MHYNVGKDNPMYSHSLSGEKNGFFGKSHTDENKKKMSDSLKRWHEKNPNSPRNNPKYGKKGPNWKGGKIISHGYILVKKRIHPFSDMQGYISEHRLVAESFLGRYLKPKEIVHHRDRNKFNNEENNLFVFENHCEHSRYEYWFRKKNKELGG